MQFRTGNRDIKMAELRKLQSAAGGSRRRDIQHFRSAKAGRGEEMNTSAIERFYWLLSVEYQRKLYSFFLGAAQTYIDTFCC